MIVPDKEMLDALSSAKILTSMITPAVLISACGTLVFSTSSRLSRVVDRTRSLSDEIQRARAGLVKGDPPLEPERGELIVDQIERLASRVLLLRSALTAFYLAIGLFVATSLGVLVSALF